MKKFVSIFAALAIFPGVTAPSLANTGSSLLIVPGQSIGKMALGTNGEDTLKSFGQPNVYDAGMSQTRQVWIAKGNRNATLYIHTTANSVIDKKPENGVSIDVIRTSSESFRTTSGVAVGSTRSQIMHTFPRARRDKDINDTIIYLDFSQGITFEFANDNVNARCIGITVFAPKTGQIIRSEDVSRLIKDNQQ